MLTRLGLYGGPRAPYVGFSAAEGAAVVAASLTETEVVAGGGTVVITLTNDTWVADGATFNAQRQNIINGMDAAASPSLGWNAEVRDKEVVGAVVRTSDTVVTITLTASPDYDITSDETITVTIPASAVAGSSEIIGAPTFDVTTVAEDITTGGGYWTEEDLRKLREMQQQAEQSRKRRFREQIEADAQRTIDLGEIFDRMAGIAPPDAVEELLDIVAPVVTSDAPRDALRALDLDLSRLLQRKDLLRRMANVVDGIGVAQRNLTQRRLESEDEEDELLIMMVM